jgi:hypothetical protein
MLYLAYELYILMNIIKLKKPVEIPTGVRVYIIASAFIVAITL